MPERMPVLFVGHGSPMNGIEDNAYSRSWQALGSRMPRPRAVLSVSAHWLTEGTFVHVGEQPATIHDFWGFPRELYNVRYECAGSPGLADRVISLVKETEIGRDRDWGLDHGTWVPLKRMLPAADVPVVQLSIDISRPSLFHYNLGRELAALRYEDVLIMGSGNIVHNLGRVSFEPDAEPYDWAVGFDELVRELIESGGHRALIDYENLGDQAALAIPTPDHYWPLLYVLGLQEDGDVAEFPVEGIAHGSVSMRAVLLEA